MADPVWSCTIAGFERDFRLGSFNVQRVLNGVHTARFEVLSLGGAYRPALGAEVIALRDGVRQFAGHIKKTTEQGADKQPISNISTIVDASDYNLFGERRYVTETIPAGSTLKQALQQIVPYVSDFGVTLSGSQANGPTIAEEILFDGVLFSECVNRLSQRTGYFGGIDYNKSLRLVTFGEVSAPFNDIDGSEENSVGDVEVERTRGKYANRIIFKYGALAQVPKADSFTGDGILDTFPITYPVAGPFAPVPTQDGAVAYGVVNYADDTTESIGGLLAPSGYPWEYDQSGPSITRRLGAVANGVDFTFRYDVQFPRTVIVEDAAEITANGLYEMIVADEKIFDKAEATAMAETYLSQALAVLETTKFDTYQPGLLPGQTMTLTIGDRAVSGSWLVQQVNAVNPNTLQDLKFSVSLINSDTYRVTFRQLYKDWLGGGSKSQSTGIGATPVPSGGAPFPPEGANQFFRGGQFGGHDEWRFLEPYVTVVIGTGHTVGGVAV